LGWLVGSELGLGLGMGTWVRLGMGLGLGMGRLLGPVLVQPLLV